MSDKKQETIADIVAEMRSNEFDDPSFNVYSLVAARTLARGWADRIEAAAKREREAGAEAAQICGEIGELIGREAACKEKVTDCNHLGNAAAMREALERCASMGEQIENQLGSSEDTVYAFRGERCLAHNISECARAALSAPPRNCDVGTVAEQNERFDKYCYDHRSHEICCGKCPIFGEPCCELAWSQMPYEEGDAK